MKRVLATSWHPGGINAILPVIKRLRADGEVDVVVLGYQFSEKILQSQGMTYKTLSDFGLSDVSLPSMDSLLGQLAPDLLLIGTAAQDEQTVDVIEQTATLAARSLGIPSIAVLDYWGNYALRFNDIHSDEPFKFLPDRIAIMDEYALKDMLAEGFGKEKLVITGNPHFDDLAKRARDFSTEDKRVVRERINLDVDLLVFYAANTWHRYAEEYGFWDLDNIVLIGDVIRQVDRSGLVVKLHPRTPEDDLHEIDDYVRDSGRIRRVSDVETRDVVLGSDIVCTPNSTVGIEAVYMRRPCISLQPGLRCKDHLSILTSNGVIPVGYSAEECVGLVRRALTDAEYREKTLIQNASSFTTDGRATERVAQLVYTML